MKFTKEMQDRVIKWVELNGLYPQPCGATVRSLCEACGFSDTTFDRWTHDPRNGAFMERLTRARAVFAATVEVDIVNSLVRAAKGADIKRVREKARADRETVTLPDGSTVTRTGELKTVEAFRETYTAPGDTRAAQFLLTNLAPDRWKLKQETTVQAQGVEINMSLPQEAIDGLNHAIATGAKPRAPKDEEEG